MPVNEEEEQVSTIVPTGIEGEYRLDIGEQVRARPPVKMDKIRELIDDVPDVDDPSDINYWVTEGEHEVYLEGWCDQCLAGTGFLKIEEGGWDAKIDYIVDLTPGILARKAQERGFELLDGGFIEARHPEHLYGVTWGVYRKAQPPPVDVFERRLTGEMAKRWAEIPTQPVPEAAETEVERIARETGVPIGGLQEAENLLQGLRGDAGQRLLDAGMTKERLAEITRDVENDIRRLGGRTEVTKPPAVEAEVLPMSVIEYDRRYSLHELREMARQEGLSASGSKKEIAARLIARGVK